VIIGLALLAFVGVGAVGMNWNEYTFKKTKVRVLFPAESEVQEATTEAESGKIYKANNVAEGVAYLVMTQKLKKSQLENTPEASFRSQLYDSVVEGFRRTAGIEITATRDVEFQGIPCREVDYIQNGQSYVFCRVVYHDLRVATLMMAKQHEYPNNFHADVFFGSLKFLD
jgi:hypothetical protein